MTIETRTAIEAVREYLSDVHRERDGSSLTCGHPIGGVCADLKFEESVTQAFIGQLKAGEVTPEELTASLRNDREISSVIFLLARQFEKPAFTGNFRVSPYLEAILPLFNKLSKGAEEEVESLKFRNRIGGMIKFDDFLPNPAA